MPPRAKNIFDGAILTARYFFDAIGAGFEGTLGYRQVEKVGDMERSSHGAGGGQDKGKRIDGAFFESERKSFLYAGRTPAAARWREPLHGKWPAIGFEVETAGNAPAQNVNPIMEKVMAEKGN